MVDSNGDIVELICGTAKRSNSSMVDSNSALANLTSLSWVQIPLWSIVTVFFPVVYLDHQEFKFLYGR